MGMRWQIRWGDWFFQKGRYTETACATLHVRVTCNVWRVNVQNRPEMIIFFDCKVSAYLLASGNGESFVDLLPCLVIILHSYCHVLSGIYVKIIKENRLFSFSSLPSIKFLFRAGARLWRHWRSIKFGAKTNSDQEGCSSRKHMLKCEFM